LMSEFILSAIMSFQLINLNYENNYDPNFQKTYNVYFSFLLNLKVTVILNFLTWDIFKTFL
jgi:hypothetical protein